MTSNKETIKNVTAGIKEISAREHLSLFRDAAMHSELVTEEQWARVIKSLSGKVTTEAIAQKLITQGVLTSYQAQQLRNGRSKLTLGPYLITEWIGQGGMGQVFKAVHNVMGRQCAVKVLPLEKSTPESRQSFTREIRLQAGLDHPHLVRAFDAGQDGNVHYLVTEYIPGTDLRKLVRKHTALPINQAASILSQAAHGLQYAHEIGLVHRDVKPGNILVTPEGLAKLSDVGLAAWSMGMGEDPRAGKVVGTADYLSPEQIRSPLKIGPASDIYSLGCTLYYTITGKVPFPGGDSRSKCKRHLEQTPWHPRKFAIDVPEDFVEIIADMMEKDPERRISTAAEVAERLEAWVNVGADAIDDPIDHQSWTDESVAAEMFPASSWTAPPPPMETTSDPAGYRVDDDAGSLADGSQSDDEDSGSQSSRTVPPVPGEDSLGRVTLDDLRTHPRPKHNLAIAITVAIVMPISLLIGAVLGYLANEQGWWQ